MTDWTRFRKGKTKVVEDRPKPVRTPPKGAATPPRRIGGSYARNFSMHTKLSDEAQTMLDELLEQLNKQ